MRSEAALPLTDEEGEVPEPTPQTSLLPLGEGGAERRMREPDAGE
jgi:hypothetical protein